MVSKEAKESIKQMLLWRLLIVLVLILLGINIFFFQQRSEDKVSIGIILPLTGEQSNLGEESRIAIESAFQELEANKEIKLVFEDTKCDPVTALLVFKKLTEKKGIKYIIGPVCKQSIEEIPPELTENLLYYKPSSISDNEVIFDGREAFSEVYSQITENR